MSRKMWMWFGIAVLVLVAAYGRFSRTFPLIEDTHTSELADRLAAIEERLDQIERAHVQQYGHPLAVPPPSTSNGR